MHSKSKKLWLDLKIAILCRRFLLDILCYLTSGRTQPAGRNFCWGITPAHLAGERGRRPAVFGIRRRRACLGMPTDRERRNTMWRCTNDRERGCRKLMGVITVEKVKQKR